MLIVRAKGLDECTNGLTVIITRSIIDDRQQYIADVASNAGVIGAESFDEGG
jgi:hypothetical protein